MGILLVSRDAGLLNKLPDFFKSSISVYKTGVTVLFSKLLLGKKNEEIQCKIKWGEYCHWFKTGIYQVNRLPSDPDFSRYSGEKYSIQLSTQRSQKLCWEALESGKNFCSITKSPVCAAAERLPLPECNALADNPPLPCGPRAGAALDSTLSRCLAAVARFGGWVMGVALGVASFPGPVPRPRHGDRMLGPGRRI